MYIRNCSAQMPCASHRLHVLICRDQELHRRRHGRGNLLRHVRRCEIRLAPGCCRLNTSPPWRRIRSSYACTRRELWNPPTSTHEFCEPSASEPAFLPSPNLGPCCYRLATTQPDSAKTTPLKNLAATAESATALTRTGFGRLHLAVNPSLNHDLINAKARFGGHSCSIGCGQWVMMAYCTICDDSYSFWLGCFSTNVRNT